MLTCTTRSASALVSGRGVGSTGSTGSLVHIVSVRTPSSQIRSSYSASGTPLMSVYVETLLPGVANQSPSRRIT